MRIIVWADSGYFDSSVPLTIVVVIGKRLDPLLPYAKGAIKSAV